MASVITRKIPERHVPGKRLGRHVRHDPRSRRHAAETASSIVSVNHNATGLPLNQGSVGSCTAEATCAALNSTPNQTELKGQWAGHTFTQDDAYTLYGWETAAEGQPYPPNDPGGSGLEVCQAAQAHGLISSYTHAFSADDALKALVIRPIICGVNWYDSFDNPDPGTGIVTITSDATVRGGHEICGDEIVADQELIGFWQSWGSWGKDGSGKFYMGFETCERLLAEQGDVTVPVP
jgi:hypothetical protein